MKFFFYLTSIIIIVALMGLFVLKKPDGQPWFTVEGLLPKKVTIESNISDMKEKLLVTYEKLSLPDDSKLTQGRDVKIYRWKDSNGDWSYSDKPKVSAENEAVFLDPNDVIVVPAFKAASNTLPQAKSATKEDNATPSLLTTSPSNILNLYEDANNVQKLMDTRQNTIEKAENQR
jgi:hypothetical protein